MSEPFKINFGSSTSSDESGEGFAARCKDIFDVLKSHAPKELREESLPGMTPYDTVSLSDI